MIQAIYSESRRGIHKKISPSVASKEDAAKASLTKHTLTDHVQSQTRVDDGAQSVVGLTGEHTTVVLRCHPHLHL